MASVVRHELKQNRHVASQPLKAGIKCGYASLSYFEGRSIAFDQQERDVSAKNVIVLLRFIISPPRLRPHMLYHQLGVHYR